MFIFSTAKNNLLTGFKARFSPNSKGEGYLFYPKESDQGYACSETGYLKFTADFENFLKWMTRIMWIWFLFPMLLIIGLAIWQDYEFNTLEKLTIIMFPLPFLAIKGWKVYNAPEILVQGKRPIANFQNQNQNQKQIVESRIKGMSWPMLIALTIVPILGSYVFLTDASLEEWQVALGLCFFATIAAIGVYFLVRKWKIMKQKSKK